MKGKPLVKERLVEELRERAVALQTDAYVRIPSERELSESLGVSRISLRSAVKTLVAEGLLTQEQGRGTYVSPRAGLRELHVLPSPDMKPDDPFYSELLARLANVAAVRAIRLFIVRPESLPEADTEVPLVLIGSVPPPVLEALANRYKRIVQLLEAPGRPGIAAIRFDDEAIGREAAARLLDAGHRDVVQLVGPDRYASARLRSAGFTAAATAVGLRVTSLRAKMNWQGGYEAGGELVRLLKLGGSDAPTAVFAANDWMAAGLIQRVREFAIDVPRRLSVLGCDDTPLAGQFTPGLSTFRLDMKRMIDELLALLSEGLFEAAAASGEAIRLAADFVSRDSLAPPI